MIRGTTVTLMERTQTGTDAFGAPVWSETAVPVSNVLVSPVTNEDNVQNAQLYGKHAVYELSLPKGDAHDWTDCRVEIFGQMFRTFGLERQWIEENVPLRWNRKVLVERYE